MGVDGGRYSHCDPPAGLRHRKKEPFRPVLKKPTGLRTRLQRIQELDEELDRHILAGPDYFELVTDAWSANVHASTSLEGNPLGLEEVRKTTKRAARAAGDTIEQDAYHQEVVQHLMSWANPELFAGDWDIRLVLQVHKHLLGPLKDPAAGVLREDYERVQITSDDGSVVWFEGAPGNHVRDELEELLRWVNEEGAFLHPLVAAVLFFHEFESIHPFEDGNGRAGRVLFAGYLQNNGLENAHKCMFEPILVEDRDLYYRVLAWTDQTGSYTELIDYFVDAIVTAYEQAIERFREKDLLTSNVDENHKQILIGAKKHGSWFSLAEASSWVGGRSDQTISRYLKYWQDLDAIESNGAATSARRYRFKNPLSALFERAIQTERGEVGQDQVRDGAQ